MKKILCVYATRQIDSNLFMSSTIFSGLQQCGYHVDMVFMGYQSVCDVFAQRYARYFDNVRYVPIRESILKRIFDKTERTKLLYSFYIHFVKDYFIRPYSKKKIKTLVDKPYDDVLSFIPPAISGYLAMDIKQSDVLKKSRLLQFWTDPLSLGRCNDITEIPRSRFMHKRIERQLLGSADKVVFCYPLLCKMEQKLHPEYAEKMTWSDVGYTEHQQIQHYDYTVGLFGAFPSSIRNVQPLLSIIKEYPKVKFVIRGDTDINVNGSDYPNLDIKIGRFPLNEIELLENLCDVLLILGNRGGIQIPGKIYYYANYEKPLVCICDSIHADELKEYLKPLNRYTLCDNSPASIKNALDEAFAQLKDFKLEIPERLEPRNIAEKIVNEALVGGDNRIV